MLEVDWVPVPVLDRLVYKVIGKGMVFLGKRAHDRGDKTLYGKMVTALRAGDHRMTLAE